MCNANALCRIGITHLCIKCHAHQPECINIIVITYMISFNLNMFYTFFIFFNIQCDKKMT